MTKSPDFGLFIIPTIVTCIFTFSSVLIYLIFTEFLIKTDSYEPKATLTVKHMDIVMSETVLEMLCSHHVIAYQHIANKIIFLVPPTGVTTLSTSHILDCYTMNLVVVY